MTHVDTAELYGEAELVVAAAIRDRSLLRLGNDRLDCYLLHWRSEYPLKAAGDLRAFANGDSVLT
jgi:diketogulonate reductase-like aldo/keto reductase